MPRPRYSQVCLQATPYYHCIARCVRRAFLCGKDPYTGRCYDYRRDWVVQRLSELADAFAIDVCAYAAMSNHLHLVLRIDAEQAADWTDEEIIARWARLFSLPDLITRYQLGSAMTAAELEAVNERIAVWRSRLTDLSWFMRCLSEHIARKANAEDGCSGRFWEGRFKSQALLDEASVLTCMSYVDLNPVRAKIAATPEESDFTSIQARIQALQAEEGAREGAGEPAQYRTPVPLLTFAGAEHRDRPARSIPYALHDYLELVDWAGRALREDKRGAISSNIPPILQRLSIDPKHYLQHVGATRRRHVCALGRAGALRAAAKMFGRRYFQGLARAARLFPAPPGSGAAA